VAGALLGAGLLTRAEGADGHHPSMTWKLGGEAVLLRITEAGLQAIGAAPAQAPPEPQQGSVAEPEGQGAEAAAAPADAAQATAAPEATQGASVVIPRPSERKALRSAALAVLAAWDDAQSEDAGLAEAIERLRQALAKPAAARSASGSRAPHAGTKQAAVLALLRRPESASGPAIAEATGWAPHTVRGFLAALKKRGIEILVHERVRQVGPSKAGARGSFTVYRIAEAG
jgi:biotin operon repressor